MKYTIKLVERIAIELNKKLSGYLLDEVFSSGKNELFFNFRKSENHFGMKLQWSARSCFLFFNEEKFSKPVPHSTKFEQLIGLKISSIHSHNNNRSLQINFSNKFTLVFKLYNGLSNILLYQNADLLSHFRTSIENDLLLKLNGFDKELEYLKQDKKNELEDAVDLFDAFNQFNKKTLYQFAFDELKGNLIQQNNAELKRLKQLISKSTIALQSMREAIPFDEIGNIMMANLNTIKPKETGVELFDFYRNKNIIIKLKKELNAAQNAEYYYRKSKKQKTEVEQLQNRILEAETRINELQLQLQNIESVTSQKELKVYSKHKTEATNKKQELFKEFECDGFKILVGKNAANNDLLTMKHSHKNDLWLHAKGVGGSHVVVKHISGKPFTKTVIDYAASVAAYYSKSKGSAFVPVVYVERKFVRKPKGAEPGAVIVEKEEVILAKPKIEK